MQSSQQMQSFVIELLKEKISSFYYYHNYVHTMYVQEKAIMIGGFESCSKTEVDLLSAAALWHDIGFINTYAGHEEEGCSLATQYLPNYHFSQSDIDEICGMIRATKIPQSPKTKLEEIIADADLEYLGTEHVVETADKLFKEMQYLKPGLSRKDWDQTQISFLRQHHYFTSFCKQHREANKMRYLDLLLQKSS